MPHAKGVLRMSTTTFYISPVYAVQGVADAVLEEAHKRPQGILKKLRSLLLDVHLYPLKSEWMLEKNLKEYMGTPNTAATQESLAALRKQAITYPDPLLVFDLTEFIGWSPMEAIKVALAMAPDYQLLIFTGLRFRTEITELFAPLGDTSQYSPRIFPDCFSYTISLKNPVKNVVPLATVK
jgi:hypothetical protein